MEIRATTSELLSRINAGWEELQQYLAGLNIEEVTVPTDAAGWTVKDHVMHIAVWEDGIEALLQHQSRIGRMGIPEAIWDSGEIDEINAFLKDLHANKSLAEVRQASEAIHQRFVSTIGSLSDDEINLPYNHYDPSSDNEKPVFAWIVGDSYEHYAEHIPWMQAIVAKAGDIRATKAELLQRVEAGWNDIQAYLAGLSEEAMTVPTDAAGWTVKDHLMHMAVWEDGVDALLKKESRFDRMGITLEIFMQGADAINEVIRKRHEHKSLAEVRQAWQEIHQRLVDTISRMSDDELNQPYKNYDSSRDDESPVWSRIVGNTFEHYAEHKPWIQAIVAKL